MGLRKFSKGYKLIIIWSVTFLLLIGAFIRVEILARNQAYIACNASIETRLIILDLLDSSPPPPTPSDASDALIEVLETARDNNEEIAGRLRTNIQELRETCREIRL